VGIIQLFCEVDDFCKWFMVEWEKRQIGEGKKKRLRSPSLSHSEIITIIIFYHQSGYKTFKWFYQRYVCKRMRQEFPKLVSYNRFIELLPDVLMPLAVSCKVAAKQETVLELPLSIQPRFVFVKISAFHVIKPLKIWQDVGNLQLGGSMGLSCICWLMTEVKFSLFVLHVVMSMTEHLSPVC